MSGRSVAGFWGALKRFWQKDESLTLLLALLALFVFVVPVVAPRDGARGPLAATFFSLTLVAGVASVMRQRRWAVLTLVFLGVVALPLRWLASSADGAAWAARSAAADTAVLAVLAFVVLAMVLRPGAVTRHRLQGAAAAYLLLGLAWASAFEWVALGQPDAFRGAEAGGDQQWIYFSLVTLSTMGYGDITPVAPAARSLAVAEAVAGQLFLAILVSRLVALELQAKQERPRAAA
jgi:hypothetical protein